MRSAARPLSEVAPEAAHPIPQVADGFQRQPPPSYLVGCCFVFILLFLPQPPSFLELDFVVLVTTKSIHKRVQILIRETQPEINPWGISFSQGLFNMSSDSSFFRTSSLPQHVVLYEAKFLWHYDHRFGGYDLVGKAKGKGGRGLPDQRLENYLDPYYKIEPRYWVDEDEFKARVPNMWDHKWFIGFRDVTNSKLERTVVFSVIPYLAVGHKAPLVFPHSSPTVKHLACFLANMNCLVLDYLARQKIGGTSMSYFILKKLPIFPPDFYQTEDIDFISTRVLELVYTAWDVQAFAQDMGCRGAPFIWNEERRSILKAELDAYYAHLYGLTRDELRYVLDPPDIFGEEFPSETFRVLKEKEIAEYGEFRTKRFVLEAFDRLSANKQHYFTRLDPPPTDPRVAHPTKED